MRLILILMILNLISCKTQKVSETNAFEEKNLVAGPVDRLYLAVQDQIPSVYADYFQNDNNIYTSSFFDTKYSHTVGTFATKHLDTNLYVIACFDEPMNESSCVELPENKYHEEGIYNVQTPSNCQTYFKNPGIKLNSRFRYRDFKIADTPVSNFSWIVNNGAYQSGQCVELFKVSQINKNLEIFTKYLDKYNITTGDKIRLAVGGAVIAAQVAPTVLKYMPKVLNLSRSPALINLASRIGPESTLYRLVYNLANLDSQIIQIAKQITPERRVIGAHVIKTFLLRALGAFEKFSFSSVAKAISISPTCTKIFAEVFNTEIKGEMTIEEAIAFLNNIESTDPGKVREIEDSHTTAKLSIMMDVLKKAELDREELVYLALATGSIIYPPASLAIGVVLFSRDVAEVSNKKNDQNNLRNLINVFDITNDKTNVELVKIMNEKFKEDQAFNSDLISKLSPIDQEKLKKASTIEATYFKFRVHTYNAIRNFYLANMFNKLKFEDGFKHRAVLSVPYGETEAFELYVREFANSQKELDTTYALLIQSNLAQNVYFQNFASSFENFGTDTINHQEAIALYDNIVKSIEYLDDSTSE